MVANRKNAFSIMAITSKLNRCTSAKDLKPIHADMIKHNAHQDSFSMNQYITACSRFHQMNYAVLAFNQMKEPNAFVYNAMLGGLVHCSMPLNALRLFVEMSSSGILPSEYTYSSLTKACTQLPHAQFGEAVHCRVWRAGFQSQVVVQTGLIDLYTSLLKIEEARRVFDEMPERDVFAWTTMLCSYIRCGVLDSAKRHFEEIPQKNTVSWNTMIAGCAQAGDMDSAVLLFDQMPGKDLISWTTMICCYSQNKHFTKAVESFRGMKAANVRPDEVTLATVISACAHLGALDVGKQLHFYAVREGFDLDVYLGSALVDMYAKCGTIETAVVVFYKLKDKNLFCWNALIEGLATHGRGHEAIAMFYKMKKHKIKPNDVSFVSVLSACAHAGLVTEGRRMFSGMIEDYLISPNIEHYGCMVDLLGRAGFIDEALELIKGMSVEPNSVIWGALLSGCKLHKNMEIGRVATQKLLALEPDNSGYYMLLVNMYAEANRWDWVAAVRGMMKERRVQKGNPGCSWIEMGGAVHEFRACDMSHPMASEICFLLTGLLGEPKPAGTVEEWDCCTALL